jgi:hypothetical protein
MEYNIIILKYVGLIYNNIKSIVNTFPANLKKLKIKEFRYRKSLGKNI